jgi:hypothetical protein
MVYPSPSTVPRTDDSADDPGVFLSHEEEVGISLELSSELFFAVSWADLESRATPELRHGCEILHREFP